MTAGEIRDKFRALVEPGYGSEIVRDLTDAVSTLEQLDDVTVLGGVLAAS